MTSSRSARKLLRLSLKWTPVTMAKIKSENSEENATKRMSWGRIPILSRLMIRSYNTYGAGRRLAGGKIKDTKITQFIFRSVLQCEQSAEIKFHAVCRLGYMDRR